MNTRQFISLIVGFLCGALIVISAAPALLSPAREGETLFVYGTLQNEVIRFAVCGCLVTETPVTLTDYKKVGRNILPAPDESVNGAFIVVSTEALMRIDRYERIPDRYRRERMEIAGRESWVYIRNN